MRDLYFNEIKIELEKIWWNMPGTYEHFDERFSPKNDKALKDMNRRLTTHIENHINGNVNENSNEEMMFLIKDFTQSTLHMDSESTEVVFKEEYFKYSEEFIERARKLDETLTLTSIFQALKNVWTMHCMQIYFNKEVSLTDSVFAYSMLYPLTDNHIDNPYLTKEEKIDFNKRFRVKIATGSGSPLSHDEKRIFGMIDLIEGEWDREKHPKIYEALLAILDGQNLSLKQQSLESIFTDDILGISFYKGGASVLADAYLVAGSLSPDEEKFAFTYGVVLQLADDLQDIKEDLRSKHYTIMNMQCKFGKLDGLFQKYLNFIDYFLENNYYAKTKAQLALKELTRESVKLLLFASVIKNKKLVSKKLFKTIKRCSSFSPKAYADSEKHFNKHLKKLIETY